MLEGQRVPTQEQLLSDILRTLKEIKRQQGLGGGTGTTGGGGPAPTGAPSGQPPTPAQQIADLRQIIKLESDVVVITESQRELNRLIASQNQQELTDIQNKIKNGERLNNIEKERYRILLASSKLADKSGNIIEAVFGGNPDAGRRFMDQFSDSFSEFASGYKQDVEKMNNAKLPELFEELNNIANLAAPNITNFFSLIAAPIPTLALKTTQLGIALTKLTLIMRDLVSEMGQFALINLAKGITTMAFSLSDAEAQFRKTTGTSEEFGRSISTNFAALREFGISIEEVSEAQTSLVRGYSDFTMLTKSTRDDLIAAGAILSDLGMSTEDYSKSLLNLTKSMGMGPTGAAQAMINLEKFARDLGVPFNQLSSDFASISSQLAKLGSNGEVAFRRLAITSKATGLSMERLLAITNKFDTFEGAATAAGKLNAALGGNFVNSMDLMMATDPVDRFNMIRDAIDNAGLSFDTMGYYQREFIAQQVGLENASELALVMKGRYELMNGAIVQSSQDIEDAAERAQTLSSFQEKMNMLFIQFIPIIEGAVEGIGKFGTFLVQSAQTIKNTLGAMFSFFGMMRILSGKGYVTGLLSLVAGFVLLSDNSRRLQDESSTLGKSFTILKNVLSPIGKFFEGFAAAFSYLGEAMEDTINDPAFQAKLDKFVAMSETFATNFGKTAYDAGVRFAQILVVIGTSLSVVTSSVVGIVRAFRAAKGIFTGGGLGALSNAFMILSTAAGNATLSIIKGMDAFNTMGQALFVNPFNPPSFFLGIIELGEVFLNLSTAILENINPMLKLSEALSRVGDTFSGILTSAGSFYDMVTSNIGVENIRAIADEIQQINVVKAGALTGAALATAASSRVAAATIAVNNNAVGGSAQENTVQQPVTIRIGDQTLDNLIVTAVGKSIKKIRLEQG